MSGRPHIRCHITISRGSYSKCRLEKSTQSRKEASPPNSHQCSLGRRLPWNPFIHYFQAPAAPVAFSTINLFSEKIPLSAERDAPERTLRISHAGHVIGSPLSLPIRLTPTKIVPMLSKAWLAYCVREQRMFRQWSCRWNFIGLKLANHERTHTEVKKERNKANGFSVANVRKRKIGLNGVTFS